MGKPAGEHICTECGQPFMTTRSKQLRCGSVCARKHRLRYALDRGRRQREQTDDALGSEWKERTARSTLSEKILLLAIMLYPERPSTRTLDFVNLELHKLSDLVGDLEDSTS
jgi:predicted  nucleic acid-binding Zn-ribbon protein